MSFMSSRYLHVRLGFHGPIVPWNVVLMPELLRDRGYATAAVISNPLAGADCLLDRGYDHYSESEVVSVSGKQKIASAVVRNP